MSLPPEVRANYTTIIDSILAASDITLISEKKIRKGIQESVQYDITPQKAAIKALILERFDIVNARENGESAPVQSVETSEPAPTSNGHHHSSTTSAASPQQSLSPPKREADSEDMSDVVDSAPPKKKRKASMDEDAILAARLQAEEDKMARPSRGGNTRRSAPVKKKKPPKKKSSTRIKGSDESDMDDSDAANKKPRKNTGFHKPLNLSPALSELFDGEPQLSRPEVTSRIWKYIKAHELQDPSDKRYINCDDRMRAVLKQDKVHMFTMTKILSENMYNPDE